jgi:Fe-S-cluster containining protein
MLEQVKKVLRTDIHKGWKRDTVQVRNLFFSYYPFVEVGVGSKGYTCDERRREECKLFCCSEKFPARVNPLEAILLSNATSKPMDDFLQTTADCTYLYQKGKAQISSPFVLKNRNGYCVFSDMPNSAKCKEYENRPLGCKAFPMAFYTLGGRDHLIQRKGCPGFERGKPLTREDVIQNAEVGKLSYIFTEILFEFSDIDYLKKDREEEAAIILESLGVDSSSKVEDVSREKFHEFVERQKRISNMEETMKRDGVSQEWLESFMLKYYRIKEPELRQPMIELHH